jgi:CRP-like cAMP-binding protein
MVDWQVPAEGVHRRIVEEDPELFASLNELELRAASRITVASVELMDREEWRPEAFEAWAAPLGLLLIEGLLTRTVTLGDRSCVEILGPGDVLRPWVRLGEDTTISVEANFAAIGTATAAVLDDRFARLVSRWPMVTAELMNRLALRSRWLAFNLAVCHLRRIETRVLIIFWYFADRWGRVTRDGIVIPFNFQHQLIADMVGARRPSVSTALSALARDGLLQRRGDRTWLLCGDPPPELREAHAYSVGVAPQVAGYSLGTERA